ncbi:MAG: transposase [Myxococcales bacterium]|nr:transposase [Myxococcales bacterium]
MGTLTRSLRRRAKREFDLGSVEDALTGAVTVVQRSDSALRVNVHFHTLALGGVYVRNARGAVEFHPLGAPSEEDLADIARWTFERVRVLLARRGQTLTEEGRIEDMELTDFELEQPALASALAASAQDLQLFGDRAGQPSAKLTRPVPLSPPSKHAPRGARIGGFDVHAAERIDGHDRDALEKVCRYLCRPALSQERIRLHHDGRVRVQLKRAWRDGTEAVLLSPMDFISRLCALVPPPRFHILRYYGVLAPNATARPAVTARPEPEPAAGEQLRIVFSRDNSELAADPSAARSKSRSERPPSGGRHLWAWLLRRVFGVDVETCHRCGGRMKVLDVATTRADIDAALFELGYSITPPPSRAPPAPLGQLTLLFD